jgi:hypothetical protein
MEGMNTDDVIVHCDAPSAVARPEVTVPALWSERVTSMAAYRRSTEGRGGNATAGGSPCHRVRLRSAAPARFVPATIVLARIKVAAPSFAGYSRDLFGYPE